ncbi:MAG: sarcosine oxidase subunit alpha family protein [Defluviicoccus sp.]|nr:sarcosine oxidase subunit alpha family protein [Defluviicoccus sp.]MDE0385226.1 sarcosine oxidase subunit alpha family protein [Defluviicoccus sp.]
MSGPFRLDGGAIDRARSLAFRFDGRRLTGHPGDTLASALLANGTRLVGRSFKYHRPRGVFASGSEEPNALVELRSGAWREPNTRATVAELFDGLEARSQNYLGSLRCDLMAVNDLLAPFLAAGFYYKTFMWPKSFWERVYEPAIREAAGLGRLSGEADPDSYDKGFLHCDLLVVGAGPAGLAAALAAGRSGARVILADEDFVMGGRLNAETHEVDGRPGAAWAAEAVREMASMKRVRPMLRTTVFGAYDHGIYGALERRTDHLAAAGGKPRQILWRIYTRRAILCAGATERPIAFAGNDRPGIMLAGAMRAYANRFAVGAGRRVGLFVNNDDGWRTAADLAAKGVSVAAVIDVRDRAPQFEVPGARIAMGGRVTATRGRHGLKGVTLATGERIALDCLAVSGGWSPNVHLTCHHGGKPVWRERIAAFVPGGDLPLGMAVAGAAGGSLTTAAALAEGHRSAVEALGELGIPHSAGDPPGASDEAGDIAPFWHVRESKGRAWLDLQNDVTVKDVQQSHREGFRSVEHLKRYTTLGMATDQGRTANVLGLAMMAELTGRGIAETGTTVFRPPYAPVPIGAFAGRSRGSDFRPTRLTPSHDWAERRGAVFVETGMWLRAQWFPLPGETSWRQSVDREVSQTRSSVGICDVTTLGKIDIQGRDAQEFVNRIYANGFARLAVGKVRYGLMLREDGFAYDDGTTARLGENHFVMTTTTANAVLVFRNMEFARQCLWPGLDVHLISATEQWAQFAVAGPNSRRLLEKIVDPEHDISDAAFPFMACGEIGVCGGTPARLFRISFSGELAYEIAVPARYGEALMEALMAAGEEFDAVAYGTEALGVMRIEKGHAAGNELNGHSTARMLGLGRMVSKTKDCIGNVLSERPEMNRENGLEMMGFKPVDPGRELAAGAHFLARGEAAEAANDQGWMTSVAYSPMLRSSIGLGFIRNGKARIGETVRAWDAVRGTDCPVEIVSPHFYDPDGERLRG